jgi:hypothetical protein
MKESAGKSAAGTWLLLITNLPGRNQTLRMRIWRGLKAAGAALLRDGVYVLPSSENARAALRTHEAEIASAGGAAQIVAFQADSSEQDATLVALFDRTEEYVAANRQIETLRRHLAKLREPQARQQLAAIAREVAAITARDFFSGPPRQQIEDALADAEAAINARFSPDEPHPARRRIRPLERDDYRGRTWATRERLWVDRVTSAWLIRRFIDPEAKFTWLRQAKDCPRRAIGFDFDGAQFTHVDSRVTFEVLLTSFGLEHDPGLARLGALVHQLDVGGIPVAEAQGFATILAGARSLQPDDDALLLTMTPVLDSLYAAYGQAADSKT